MSFAQSRSRCWLDLDAELVNAGRELFRANCTDCHNTDQSVPVPSFVVPLAELYPAYSPEEFATRELELPFRPLALAPLQDDPSTIFDDKTVVVEPAGAAKFVAVHCPCC